MHTENEIEYNYVVNQPMTEVLLPYVSRYTHFSTHQGKQLNKNIFPSTHISLLFHFNKTKLNCTICPKIAVIGLQKEMITIQSDEEEIDALIVQLTTIGFHCLSGLPGNIITNKAIDARNIWGNDLNDLYIAMRLQKDITKRTKLLDSFFIQQLQHKNMPRPCFAELINIIQKNPEFILPKEIGISRRHLSRLFKSIAGVSMQTFRRLSRFEIAKDLVMQQKADTLTHIGYQSGYYDQSHFAREFRKLSGKRAKHFGTPCSL